MTLAFSEGDPERAWISAQELLDWTSELITELGHTRFKLNFGTDKCRNCTGLKAGPGVTATCYQLQACYYTNFRGDELTSAQARIIDLLGKK